MARSSGNLWIFIKPQLVQILSSILKSARDIYVVSRDKEMVQMVYSLFIPFWVPIRARKFEPQASRSF